jgi:hypothetical protein
MKKLMQLTMMLAAILIATPSFSAGTCVESGTNPTMIFDGSRPVGSVVTLLCTHHTDNSLSATVAASTMAKLSGKYVFAIKSYPGTTAPTDGTDLSIVDSDGLSLIGVADNGLNFIDATSTYATTFYNGHMGTNTYWMPVTGEAWTISTANNAVASATFYLKIYLVP